MHSLAKRFYYNMTAYCACGNQLCYIQSKYTECECCGARYIPSKAEVILSDNNTILIKETIVRVSLDTDGDNFPTEFEHIWEI